MQVYLVGGAVRDGLLGLAVRERDWVVVGATPAELEALGYRPVGRDFPVFLHPGSSEEYALARVERKTGPGYRGFVTAHSPDVTLEQDLQRRDLTINAMARAEDGTLVDPHGGRADLEARLLRHVSPAFSEDPVRILRVARFLARFAPLGFHVAPGTLALMRAMVAAGEAQALVPERVWKELERALGEPEPWRALELLQDCGAMAVLAPELSGALARDAAATLAPLHDAVQSGLAPAQRWAALVAPLGEATAGSLADRLRAPNGFRELAATAARLLASTPGQAAAEPAGLAATGLLACYEACDALRRPERFESALAAAALASPDLATHAARLLAGLAIVRTVRLGHDDLGSLPGPAIAARLHALRLAALTTGAAGPAS
jgi:tRNA nucleotidyltransferase (CCA-adding enzyme)